MSDETLSKAELALIDKIIGALGLLEFRNLLWKKVERAFSFTFKNTQVNYGFTHATPDPLALKYLEERVFILSDKTRDRLTGNMRWELLEGIRNTESISDIKKRLDGVFTGMQDYEIERIARTETLNAMNAGRLEAYKASEVTHYKMWRAAINNKRTAADSRRLHGQIQELDDPFVDPKTGEGVMHPPNRPNCRCAMIPLRKLPENVVRKGGQMYAADEMVGKIEIDVESLIKSEKRIWIKPTAKRKGHYRKVKGVKKVEVKKKEVWEKLSSDFISEEDTEAEPGSLVPTYTDFKDGDMRLDSLAGQIDILKPVKLDDLHYRESVSDIIDMGVVNQYVEWINEGIMPPPITVIEDFRGRKETLNRRRVYAMRLAGIKSTLAWQFYGNRKRIIKDAITSGKKVPLEVRKEVGEEMVGKIEIDITSLQKGEKRVWVKATAKRKGHYRKVKGAGVIEVDSKRKFVMNEEEANVWAKDSIYKDYIYHGTTIENSKGIESGGFSDNKVGTRLGNAGMYGRGFYFGINKSSSAKYAEDVNGLLKAKINVKKLCDIKCWKELDKKYKLWDMFLEDVIEGPTKVRDILIKEGYDGVCMISETVLGYGEICIFESKNIMVIR